VSPQPTVYEARQALLRAALNVLADERALADASPPVSRMRQNDDALAIAARDLTVAIDELPPRDRPKGWARDEDGRTA
jgi:hypothetical protein